MMGMGKIKRNLRMPVEDGLQASCLYYEVTNFLIPDFAGEMVSRQVYLISVIGPGVLKVKKLRVLRVFVVNNCALSSM